MTAHHNTTAPNPLLRELHAAHSLILRDLQACRSLVDSAGSVTADSPLQRLAALRRMSLLIRTRQDLLVLCRLLREHHDLEDTIVLPPVRVAAPHLTSLVEHLHADHQELDGMLERIETTLLAAGSPGDASIALARLAVALDDLGTWLRQHFEREEMVLGPVIEAWPSWPRPALPEA
ncbi:hemerythrin domain-containing protein [Promicromonospora sukumoe]|uniref:hemerythrin domain-containing protein n=1 Tax=Promicromonospora sukumoe TaxID=88382 RepID=UPI0037C922E8